ncbi:DUF6892 domain-containing protein [Cryptosporangium phraense]|uniref:DUF6892 domain-containing protein n=1 Tax=Cryptosporangium phraense TaxID=2593070 RepID=A0A545AEK6_9ACTN|nr:hypothetical protein [Cryptosporangium phraense]TQS39700.1 hypothetical protein FL583_38680 [Cryptosporangium phraense]
MPNFFSFQFKLVVLEQISGLEIPSPGDAYSYGAYEPVPAVERYLREYWPSASQLAGVTSLVFDGGLAIYGALTPGWDGESDELDVLDLRDLALLPGLSEVLVISMIPDWVDVAPLLALPRLRRVFWRRIARDSALAGALPGVQIEG